MPLVRIGSTAVVTRDRHTNRLPLHCILITKVLLKTFIWIGSKLFRSVVIYSPEEAGGNVLVIHFGVSQQAIANSCRELSENSLA
jgi:hypothetical protein